MNNTKTIKKPELKKEIALQQISPNTIAQIILNGDLRGLNPQQKVEYYNGLCSNLGLNAATKPFEYLVLKGKEVLYPNKGCAEQLRMIHRISVKIVDREQIENIYIVTAEASTPDGRVDSSTGCLNVIGLRGEDLANAFMKTETKAKRRVTLSICGLNMLDESEAQTIKEVYVGPQSHDPIVSPLKIEPKKEVLKKETSEMTREELAKEIVSAGKVLGLSGKSLMDFIKEETGKSSNDLAVSEMQKLLDRIQEEIGRK